MENVFDKELIEKLILEEKENPTEFVLGIYKDENTCSYCLVRKNGNKRDLTLTNTIFNNEKEFDKEVKMISLLFKPTILQETA